MYRMWAWVWMCGWMDVRRGRGRAAMVGREICSGYHAASDTEIPCGVLGGSSRFGGESCSSASVGSRGEEAKKGHRITNSSRIRVRSFGLVCGYPFDMPCRDA
ncbi:hypothetical protein QBC40DRAFT_45134 [Triangularia verruculosa]|uniref:Uncharacterized protein n=1 Tax=Triangularia verruculosa TaxID=2587418 RepID=A0AAN7AV40_9PEZI|nr:hypothetical protein QBC40DRAFT_45134 [Triangularia verruculosa]